MAATKIALETRAYWNNFATIYEKFFLKTTIQINNLIIPLIDLHPSHTIAECGCGTGSGVELLLHYYPNLSKILANDISETMIQIAQSKNLPNSEFFVANNENLPYDSNSCDRYISNLSLFLVENPENMLKEAWRVLKPGGKAVFSVFGVPGEHNFYILYSKSANKIGIELPVAKNYFHLNDKTYLNTLMSNAGFTNIQSCYVTVPYLANSADEFVEMFQARPDTKRIIETYPELVDDFWNMLRSEYNNSVNGGNFITFDSLIVAGHKI